MLPFLLYNLHQMNWNLNGNACNDAKLLASLEQILAASTQILA